MVDLNIEEIKESLEVISKYIVVLKNKKTGTGLIQCNLLELKRVRKIFIKLLKQTKNKTQNINITPILDLYNEKIHKLRKQKNKYYITSVAQNKIFKRLEIFSIKEISKAINNFSENTWWMEHNAHRGLSWFFHTDDRLQMFINMESTKQKVDPAILRLEKLTKDDFGD